MSRTTLWAMTLLIILTSASYAQQPCDDLSMYPVRFAILGDRTGEHQEGVFGQCVQEVARLRPDFVVTVGDAIEGYTSDTSRMRMEWEEYFGLIEPLTMPVYHTPGNHDITSDQMEPAYRTYIGKPNNSFDHRGIHFVVLDNSRYESPKEFTEEELDWLKKDLATHADACYTIVFFHKPFWYRTLADGKPDILHDIFKANGVDAVFTGHFHKYFAETYDGIQYTSIGSSGGSTEESPNGLLYHFAWVTVDGDGIHTAPIKKDAVLPWNVQTAEELRTAYIVQSKGLKFSRPALVSNRNAVENDTVLVVLRDQVGVESYDDTLRWKVPDGWSVSPMTYPYHLAGDSSLSVPFVVHSSDKLYPLPTLYTRLPYADDMITNVSAELEITRPVNTTRAKAPVTVDGQLTEACWKKPISALYDYEGNLTGNDSSAVYFAYDNNNLYLAVYCHESVMDSISAEMTERDADVFTEDAFGFMYQPNATEGELFQFYVNPLGTVYDQHITQQSDGYWTGDPLWNGEYEVKTSRGDGYYIVEARIPMDQFGHTIESGDSWRVNFRRKQRRVNNAYALQIPWSYDPKNFGVMKFE